MHAIRKLRNYRTFFLSDFQQYACHSFNKTTTLLKRDPRNRPANNCDNRENTEQGDCSAKTAGKAASVGRFVSTVAVVVSAATRFVSREPGAWIASERVVARFSAVTETHKTRVTDDVTVH